MADREEISRLMADVAGIESNDPDVKKIQKNIAELDGDVTKLMNPAADGSGWKILTQQDKESLIQKYESCMTQMNAYLNQHADDQEPDPNREHIRQTMQEMWNFFREDVATIRAYNPAREPKSLATLFEDARTVTIETNGHELERWGGALSSRIPLTTNLNGKVVSGVFTPKKIYDPAGRLRGFFEEALAKVPAKKREQARQVMESVLNPAQKYPKTNPNLMPGEENTSKAHALNFLNHVIQKDNEGYTFVSEPHLLEAFALQSGMTPAAVKKLFGTKAIEQLQKTIDDGEIIVNGDAKMPEGADITMRNVAMSRVADYFGVPEVIARSRPMKMKIGNQVVEGVFMEKAEGIDLSKSASSPDYVDRNPMDGTDGEGLRQAADLQVLDFICGNIDRHRNNMFYKFDKNGKFAGVQGIDNDCCFGKFFPMGRQNHLVGIGDLQMISEEMSRKIMNTTEEQLRMLLHGMIEEEAIDAACFRLQQVQQKIRLATPENTRNTDSIKMHGALVPLKREGWAQPFVRKIIKSIKENNIFKKVFKSADELSRSKNPYLRVRDRHMQSFGNNNRATLGGVYSQYDKGGVLISMLDRATKGKRTSPEFEAIRKAINDYRKYTADLVRRMNSAKEKVENGEKDPAVIQDQRVSNADFMMMQKKLQEIKKASDHYHENKLNKLGGAENASKYEQKRLRTSELVSEFVDSWSKMQPEEEKQLKINNRQNVEEMIRANKEPAPAANEEAPQLQ